MFKKFYLFTLVFSLLGCANPINQGTGLRYTDLGNKAEMRGDYKLAEEYYGRALANFQVGHTGDANISMGLYNLGRTKGYLCKYDEAEKLLLEALQLEVKVSGPESEVISGRLFALAYLYFDRQQFEKAADYYARGIPIAKKLGFESRDPLALADAIDEYSIALRNSGSLEKAQSAKHEANTLRMKNPEKKAEYVRIRNDQKCL